MSISDTSGEAADRHAALLQSKTISQRLALALSLSNTTIALSKRAILRVRPECSENDLRCCFVELHYGPALAERFRQYLQERSK